MSGLEMNVQAADTTGYLIVSFKAKLNLYNMTVESIKALDKKILEIAKEGNCQDIARKLEQIPGVGWHSAAIIATEVADFKSLMARKLAVKAYHIARSEPCPEKNENQKKAA